MPRSILVFWLSTGLAGLQVAPSPRRYCPPPAECNVTGHDPHWCVQPSQGVISILDTLTASARMLGLYRQVLQRSRPQHLRFARGPEYPLIAQRCPSLLARIAS